MVAASTDSSDPCTCTDVTACKIDHILLNWDVNFEKKEIGGSADLTVTFLKGGSEVSLDVNELRIKGVQMSRAGADQVTCQFSLHPQTIKAYGECLQIQLPTPVQAGEKIVLRTVYNTTPSGGALQWLSANQTAGKKHPYLFSQCQAIFARSLFPCQDTPAVKFTYEATVTAPKDLVVLMSAVPTKTANAMTDENKGAWTFEQKVPIPSYLMAIAVGSLKSKRIGPRSLVWTEEEHLDTAAHEFAETEKMLGTAESLAGPYVWGEYSILVLPPSFPFGGMENPCVTFATPTLLAGDRSLADVIAHEISHSWTGNLVTINSFEHFWLNEGHTVYLERLIKGKMFGEPLRHLSAISGWNGLIHAVNQFGADSEFTKLVPCLSGQDPEEAFSVVPYEKGHTLLYCLEVALGGQDEFVGFLRSLFEKFKFKSINTADWKEHLYAYFEPKASFILHINTYYKFLIANVGGDSGLVWHS